MKPIVSGKGLTLRLCKAATQVRANERLAGKLNVGMRRPQGTPEGLNMFLEDHAHT